MPTLDYIDREADTMQKVNVIRMRDGTAVDGAGIELVGDVKGTGEFKNGVATVETSIDGLSNDYTDEEKAKVAGAVRNIEISGQVVTVAWNDGRTKQMITQDTSYGVVTSSRNGLMSAADKRKLDSLTPAAYEILSDEELEALLV